MTAVPGQLGDRFMAARRRGVLLIGLGEPDAPDVASVRRYLGRVLSDPEVTRLPRVLSWLRPGLGRVLGAMRAARAAERYRRGWPGTRSPLLTATRELATGLAGKLPGGMRVLFAMRYGRPSIAEVVREISAIGIEDLVVIPLYPLYGGMTTRTIIRELQRQIERAGFRIDVTTRTGWHEDVGYVNAQARLIDEFAAAHGLTPESTRLVYSAPTRPALGDEPPGSYAEQLRRTAELVSQRLEYPADRTSLGFHGDPSWARRLGPPTTDVLAELVRGGEQQVLVCPLGIVVDDLDTLADIQVAQREQFERAGGRFFACPALNSFEPFIAALRKLAVHGKYAMCHGRSEPGPPASVAVEDADAPLASLVMVGVSQAGPLGVGRGPRMVHADAEQFRQIKKPRCDVPAMLRAVCAIPMIREGLLWNTCRRFEFYAWLTGVPDAARLAEVTAHVRRHLFTDDGGVDFRMVNVLRGADAWHHLMRTASGLNSGLPGEREVLEQLHTAVRLAERAGTAGVLMDRLLSEISKRERRLREQTPWGQYDPSYCQAAIAPIVRSARLDLLACRCVVVGGSTTSCGILDTLAEHFDVPRRELTLLHRGHGQGGHLKMLRKAIGSGRRIRVNRYDERIAIRTIAEADVVLFGLDSREPVLRADRLRGLRDFPARPLTVFDFNMFGSTAGLSALDGVRVWNAADLEAAATAYADQICGSAQFAEAVATAESWIRDRLPSKAADRAEGRARRQPVS